MASLPFFITAALQSADIDSDALTFREILANIPHDPATIVVLLLLASGVVAILRIGRSHGPKPPRSTL